MSTIEVSRRARFAVVIGMILALGLGGCVVRERERAVPYPVYKNRTVHEHHWKRPPQWRNDGHRHRDDDRWHGDRRPRWRERG